MEPVVGVRTDGSLGNVASQPCKLGKLRGVSEPKQGLTVLPVAHLQLLKGAIMSFPLLLFAAETYGILFFPVWLTLVWNPKRRSARHPSSLVSHFHSTRLLDHSVVHVARNNTLLHTRESLV